MPATIKKLELTIAILRSQYHFQTHFVRISPKFWITQKDPCFKQPCRSKQRSNCYAKREYLSPFIFFNSQRKHSSRLMNATFTDVYPNSMLLVAVVRELKKTKSNKHLIHILLMSSLNFLLNVYLWKSGI